MTTLETETDVDSENARRVIPLKGLYNVRDLGGYAAGDGKIKWGILYRAGDLADLLPETRTALEALGIRSIVDFREAAEQRRAPDGEVGTVKNRYNLPIKTGNIIDFFNIRSADDAEAVMLALYRRLPFAAREEYRDFFHILEDPENAPVLFHCSAGKDRTGFAAALLLSALGCGRDTVAEDYMLSAELLAGKYDDIIAASPVSRPYMTVRREYIEAALDAIEQEAGGIEQYLRNYLEVEPDILRRLYISELS